MLVPPAYVLGGVGLLTSALAVPLALRKVPMNRGYGVRLPQAFASEENWYAINAYGGRLLLGFGLLLLAFAVLTRDVAPAATDPLAPVYMVVPLLGLVPVVVLVKRFARRL